MRPYRVKKARPRAPRKVTNRNKRRKWKISLRSPELNWMDQLLRSFKGVAPADWIPGPYLDRLKHDGKFKITYH